MKKSRKIVLSLFVIIATVVILILAQGVISARSIAPYDPVKVFTGKCTFYSPVRPRNLTIIPVKVSEKFARSTGFLTLDEAIAGDALVVKEISSSGSVNKLAVTNNSKKTVFIMAGEIMSGSKQDRVLQNDVLLPPMSGKVLVDVYCVEHGRWTYKSDKFYTRNQAANISVRQAAKEKKSQSAVWDSVAKTNKSFDAAPSGSLSESYNAPEMKKERKEYQREIIDIPGSYPNANGVVVLINGRVLVADIFADRRIFKKMWPKLADSYIMEAVSKPDTSSSSSLSTASDFIDLIQSAKVSYTMAPGTGKQFEISSDSITGSGIIYNDIPIHIDVFPRSKDKVKPYNSPIRRNYQNNVQQQINQE